MPGLASGEADGVTCGAVVLAEGDGEGGTDGGALVSEGATEDGVAEGEALGLGDRDFRGAGGTVGAGASPPGPGAALPA